MNDDLLFSAAPYVAALAWLVATTYRSVAGLLERSPQSDRHVDPASPFLHKIVGGSALALIALHLALLVAPAAILGWNVSEPRLLLLEAAGLIAGAMCLIGLGRRIWRRVVSGSGHVPSISDGILTTLIGMEIVSGLMLALFYRWASSWSVVTLSPYAVSLIHFNPRVELVAGMPLLVRLHVFCTFAMLVAMPFTTVGSMAVVAVRCAAATTAAPVTRTCRLFGAAAGEWTRRRVRPLVSWDDDGS